MAEETPTQEQKPPAKPMPWLGVFSILIIVIAAIPCFMIVLMMLSNSARPASERGNTLDLLFNLLFYFIPIALAAYVLFRTARRKAAADVRPYIAGWLIAILAFIWVLILSWTLFTGHKSV